MLNKYLDPPKFQCPMKRINYSVQNSVKRQIF